MNYQSKPFVKCIKSLPGFVIALIILIILILGGCRSVRTKYIPVESTTVRTDTFHHIRKIIRHDTVTFIERVSESRLDSIAPILDSIGRMIGYDRWHIIDRSASLLESNSRLQTMIDSLKSQAIRSEVRFKPYPVEKLVETNRLYLWQRLLMGVGIITIVAICITIAWRLKIKK